MSRLPTVDQSSGPSLRVVRRRYSLSELLRFSLNGLRLALNFRRALNFLLVKVSWFLKLERSLGMPIHINIEPAGACNFHCPKCNMFSATYTDDGDAFPQKNMPMARYRQIIDEVANTLVTLRLWHFGEPLLNPDIYEMISYAKQKDIIVAISSNLSPLTRDNAEKLVRSGLDYLVVSLDAASEATFDLYHAKGQFRRVVDNLKTLVEVRRTLGARLPFIELQFIIMNENEGEIEAIGQLAREIGVDKLTFLRVDDVYVNHERFGLSEGGLLPAHSEYRLRLDEINRIPGCRIPWEGPVIRYSGVVLPCVTDISHKHAMGNLFSGDGPHQLRDIWNSDGFRAFRRQLKTDINGSEICVDCAQRDGNCRDQIDP